MRGVTDRLDYPIGLRFVGDSGLAHLTRICGWLAHELSERSEGDAFSTIRTGDAGVGNLRALGRREVDVAVVTPSAIAALALRGTGPFAGEAQPGLRAIGELPHRDKLLFAASADLGVTSVADVRERQLPLRLATSIDAPGSPFAGYAIERVLTAAGLAPETLREWGGEVIASDMPFACTAAVADGRADAVLQEAIMMPWWQALAERRPLSFLPFEPDVLAAVDEELACPPGEIPAGYLPGMDEPVATVDFRGYLVVVREDMPDDVASLLAWIMSETSAFFVGINYGHLPANRSPVASPVERNDLMRTPIPLHPGAADCYSRLAS
jgi:TRAP-type uncharacterized transport system substrate-binding protein